MGETWILAMASGSLGAWTLQQLVVHGPKWENVTPMLIGISTLIGAIASYQNHRQIRKHADEKHRLSMGQSVFVQPTASAPTVADAPKGD